MSTLRKTASLGIGALGLPLLASTAMASTLGFSNTGAVTYATEAVKAANGQITIPSGDGGVYLATAVQASPSSGAFTLTFTLPPGVTPAGSTVAATLTGGGSGTCGASSSQLSGTVSGQTITFTVTTNVGGASGDQCQISLNTFTVTGATALETPVALGGTPGSGFPIKAQLTASGSSFNPFNTDVAPQPADLAGSKSALSLSVTGSGLALADVKGTFDGVSAPYKVFASTTPAVSTTGITVANLFISNSGAMDTSGQAVYSLGAPATVTVSGNLSGFDGFYLDPAGAVCKATETAEKGTANVIAGTPSGSTATLPGITVGTSGSPSAVTLCGYVGGAALIGANAGGLSLGVTAGPASTSKSGSATAFNGGVPFIAAYTGNISSYPTFLRIVNGTGTKQSVICDIQADNGSEGVTLAESGLAAGANDLVAVSSLVSSAGVEPDASGRAAMYCAPSANGVLFEHMMLNPDGTVTQIGDDINTVITTISTGAVGLPPL